MLFHSSIRRELARSFGAAVLVLFTIVIIMFLIGVLGQANKGSVNPEEIILVLTYSVLGRSPTILTIALFVAVVSTLSRMYRDSEMVIWMTSGRGVAGMLVPVFRFAWPVLLVIGVLIMWAWPWSNQQIETMRDRFEQRGDLDRVAPGQFRESAGGRRVFFIEKSDGDAQEGRNVFIANRDLEGKESVTSARSAQIEWEEDRQLLRLSHGQRIDQPLNPSTDDLRVSEFGSYAIVINEKIAHAGPSGKLNTLPTLDLLDTSNRFYAAELSWRLGMVITAFNFVLLAVAISSSNPRVGKSGNLMFLLFAFILYHNLLNLGLGWVMGQKVHWLELMLKMHGGVFLVSSLWLAKRHYNWQIFPSLKRSGAA
jgi:lipopolysaccharide export system permease protein